MQEKAEPIVTSIRLHAGLPELPRKSGPRSWCTLLLIRNKKGISLPEEAAANR